MDPVLIVQALYGLKSSGARWRDHMAGTLLEAGYESCKVTERKWDWKQDWNRPGI